uniref:Serine hydrolase like 2 n=1 Tax=Propithecus coquereli TaxID=379532 RepID=A0A2K6FSA3_PROCO
MGMLSELKLTVPWGHIAAKTRGFARGPPVLCLHGWLDNANSFNRLIPLLPQDFHYVVMDFGGHGLSSRYSPGERAAEAGPIWTFWRLVFAAMRWSRFSFMGHSFGRGRGQYTGTFPCEMENVVTYKRRAIEHVLQVEALQKPPSVISPEEMIQGRRIPLISSARSCVCTLSGSCRPTSC